MTRRQVDQEIEKALSVWSDHTDLTFTQKRSGKVHIDISFLKGEHGDGDPFDGSGGTLAHAFFPVFGGDAHFDDAENWTKGSFRGEQMKKLLLICFHWGKASLISGVAWKAKASYFGALDDVDSGGE